MKTKRLTVRIVKKKNETERLYLDISLLSHLKKKGGEET